MTIKPENFKAMQIYASTIILVIVVLMAILYLTLKKEDEVISTKITTLDIQVASAKLKINTLMKDIDQKQIADEVKLIAAMTILKDAMIQLEARNTELDQLIPAKKFK